MAKVNLCEFSERWSRPLLGLKGHQFINLYNALRADEIVTADEPWNRHQAGQGVIFTPYMAGCMLLATLAGAPKSNPVPQVVEMFHLRAWAEYPDGSHAPCEDSRTGAMLFGDALTRLLGDPALAARVDTLSLHRTGPEASVTWLGGTDEDESFFGQVGGPNHGALDDMEIRFVSQVSGKLLAAVARDLS